MGHGDWGVSGAQGSRADRWYTLGGQQGGADGAGAHGHRPPCTATGRRPGCWSPLTCPDCQMCHPCLMSSSGCLRCARKSLQVWSVKEGRSLARVAGGLLGVNCRRRLPNAMRAPTALLHCACASLGSHTHHEHRGRSCERGRNRLPLSTRFKLAARRAAMEQEFVDEMGAGPLTAGQVRGRPSHNLLQQQLKLLNCVSRGGRLARWPSPAGAEHV